MPLLLYDGTLISVFKLKANHFNSYFSSQYTLIDTSSKLPILDPVDIKEEHIYLNTEINLMDDISIRMIKVCGKSIAFPLKFLLPSSLEKGVFSVDWKKSNIVPVHKKIIKI